MRMALDYVRGAPLLRFSSQVQLNSADQCSACAFVTYSMARACLCSLRPLGIYQDAENPGIEICSFIRLSSHPLTQHRRGHRR